MRTQNTVAIWASQIRTPFLLLSVVLVAIGGAAAWHYHSFHGLYFLLCLAGVICAHCAVNLFNEHSDNATRIDYHTTRTPFSGGTGNIQAGLTSPKSVMTVAIALLSASSLIGIYLSTVSGPLILAFMVTGALASIFYTTHLARWGLGEIMAGLCLGSLVVLGTFYALTQKIPPSMILVAVPPGILTSLLLLLNEFPDIEPDRQAGRRHLVILLGWKRAAILYGCSLAVSYGIMIAGVCMKWFPLAALLTILTVPFSIRTTLTAFRSGNQLKRMVPALGINVGIVLGTDLLIAVAYLL